MIMFTARQPDVAWRFSSGFLICKQHSATPMASSTALPKLTAAKHPIYFRLRLQTGNKQDKIEKNGGGEGKVSLSDLIVN